jgi:diacylglycerol kinase family enzyme
MSVERIGIVWNPSKIEREDLEAAFGRALESAGADPSVIWLETTEDDPGQGAAGRALAAGAGLVIAAGGDGTVRAVAEHLAEVEAEADLGIVPLGTGNLLARNLDVPLNDPAAAFVRALVGSSRPIDVGWAEVVLEGETRRCAFTVMAGFGIDAHMITETDDDLKGKVGWLAYVESLGRAVSASEVIGLGLALDGGELAEIEAHTLIVGNCGDLQGGVTLMPDADPADGRLDLLILDAEGLVGWLDTLRNVVWDNGIKRLLGGGEASAESSVSAAHRQAERIRLELGEPRVFEVDGDDLGETTRIDISVQAGGVRVR